MNQITTREVTTKKDFRKFLRFPYKLFEDDSMWVPSLIMDEKTTFNPKKNPALDYCDCKIFLAYRAMLPLSEPPAVRETELRFTISIRL